MPKQTVNLGTMADNKSGDPLRTAFEKINDNFDELYASIENAGGGVGVNIGSMGNEIEPAQVSTLLVEGADLFIDESGIAIITIPEIPTIPEFPPIPDIGDVTFSGTAIIGSPTGQVGHRIEIATDYLGNTPAPNSSGILVDPQYANQITVGDTITFADGQTDVIIANYFWSEGGYQVIQYDNVATHSPTYPVIIQSEIYDVGTPTHLVLSSGNTAPGSAIDIKETEIDMNFSGGDGFSFSPTGVVLPKGSTISEIDASSTTVGESITIQAEDLASATFNWTGSPVIDGASLITDGWDYIGFDNAVYRGSLFTQLNGADGQLPVTWADGSSASTGFIRVNFGDGNVFQFVPTDEFGSNPAVGTWVFPATIGTSTTVTIPAHTKLNVEGEEWKFGADGTTQIPGALVKSTVATTGSGDPVYTTAIDLTKTINKLAENANSLYTLADGAEGQIMYLVPQNGVSQLNNIVIRVDNARAGINVGTQYYLFFNNDIITLIFTDGAWGQVGGIWD